MRPEAEGGPAGLGGPGSADGPSGRGGPVRIAMWSGPRTLSTALMRSFGSRPDTVVIDEPLYAYYLAKTGLDHPGREEILASMPAGWAEVMTDLAAGQPPDGAAVIYAKHMTHHLLPEVDRTGFAGMRHAFLIRDPRRLLASYAKVRDTPTLADLGLEQQVEIFRRFGGPVIDAADLAARPAPMLEALCDALGIGFDPAMLSWPAGPQPSDGVWGTYWYAGVWSSTGFARDGIRGGGSGTSGGRGASGTSDAADGTPGAGAGGNGGGGGTAAASTAVPAELPTALEPLAAQCRPFYDELSARRLRVS